MKKNTRNIFIACIIFLLFLSLCILSAFLKRIPSNDPNLAGNTAGNLYNEGLFCEADGKVYFSNPYDKGSLYSMNSDETNIRKLVNSQVFAINAGGSYLYYCLNNSKSGGTGLGYISSSLGLYRCKKNGNDTTCLRNTAVVTATLCGDYLYYLNYNNKEYTRLYKMKTDKSEDVEIANYVINPSCYNDGIIYFAGTQDDHNLYGLYTANDNITALMEGNIYNPVYYGGYIYYMDLNNKYRLCRYSLSGNLVEILTEDRIDAYNIGSDMIYYQKNSATEPALMRMYTDGSFPEVVAPGNYSKINMTSQYVYFYEFNNYNTIYHTPVTGSINITAFDSARQAVKG